MLGAHKNHPTVSARVEKCNCVVSLQKNSSISAESVLINKKFSTERYICQFNYTHNQLIGNCHRLGSECTESGEVIGQA